MKNFNYTRYRITASHNSPVSGLSGKGVFSSFCMQDMYRVNGRECRRGRSEKHNRERSRKVSVGAGTECAL